MLPVALQRLIARTSWFVPREVSAMVRVKNEEEFLYPAVKSIAGAVDEIVLIDNLSADRSPLIMEALAREHPAKVVRAAYRHDVLRVGRESRALASEPGFRRSPHLSANYYNWCLRRCSRPFVLKWDADMIATDAFRAALEEWRRSPKLLLTFRGANVHPDRRHLAASRIGDREELRASSDTQDVPIWAAALEYDFYEPRLFPKAFARYEMGLRWTQRLSRPFHYAILAGGASTRVPDPCFLHLKLLKKAPFSSYSDDLARTIASNLAVGPALEPGWEAVLRRLRLWDP